MSISNVPRGRISKILSPALRFWLRSQVDRLDRLELDIAGKNRQILTGFIPKVSLVFEGAIYQALHFRQGWAIGENIRINLGQVIKGKPLQILEPITVTGALLLTEADLKNSLNSPLLATALKDFLMGWVEIAESCHLDPRNHPWEDWEIDWHDLKIVPGEMALNGTLIAPDRHGTSLSLRSGLQIEAGSQLHLSPLTIDNTFLSQPPATFSFDLGSEVEIETLSLSEGQLFIKGTIVVKPVTSDC
ncbi:MAG: DUF2993 domain-containing protein [Cyanobacteria bacterium SBLK]|nr:DUF2993 domain-containing protein [Cyanobacteria bacterium SBLK]